MFKNDWITHWNTFLGTEARTFLTGNDRKPLAGICRVVFGIRAIPRISIVHPAASRNPSHGFHSSALKRLGRESDEKAEDHRETRISAVPRPLSRVTSRAVGLLAGTSRSFLTGWRLSCHAVITETVNTLRQRSVKTDTISSQYFFASTPI